MLPVEADERVDVVVEEVVPVLRCLTAPLDGPAPDLVAIVLLAGALEVPAEPTVVALDDWVMLKEGSE